MNEQASCKGIDSAAARHRVQCGWTIHSPVVRRHQMSESLTKIIERMSTDATFRAELERDPEAALAGYQLTAAEKAALRSRDEKALSDLGVDARITKQALSGDEGGAWPNTPFSS